jgi:VWFA-related protein
MSDPICFVENLRPYGCPGLPGLIQGCGAKGTFMDNRFVKCKYAESRLAGVCWGLAIFLLLGCAMDGVSQESLGPQRIRVESTLITVPVIASDPQGKFLPGLNVSEFKLFDDGAPVPISLFLTSEDPVKIALLIDTSISTTTVLKKIKQAAEQFLLQLRPKDMAMVASFDSEIQVLCPFSSDPKELKEGIRSARSGGSQTKMRDAINQTALQRFRSITGRKAIIVLTDGQDRGSQISARDLLYSVASSNTLVYSIFYRVDPRQLMKELFGVPPRKDATTAPWDELEAQAAQYLEKLADLSAGRFYRGNAGELDVVFKQISDELRAQYLLGFYPDTSKLDGSTHTLVVSVSVPDAVVRSRLSYRAVPPKENPGK